MRDDGLDAARGIRNGLLILAVAVALVVLPFLIF